MRLIKYLLLSAMLFTVPAVSQAQDTAPAGTESGRFAAGILLANLSSGLSVKFRATDKITAQGTLGFFGVLSRYGVRGLYHFDDGPFYQLYGYGEIAMWRWGGTFGLRAENTFGFGGGGGMEYDLRGISPDLPPLFASAELGINLASFDNYASFSRFGLGLALHYRF